MITRTSLRCVFVLLGPQAHAALTAKDYQQMTLMMHAAAAGNAAAFQEVVKAVDSHLSDAEVGPGYRRFVIAVL